MNWYKTSQQEQIIYIMRGLPGSGKSTKAKQLSEGGIILSTDDFWMVNNEYKFDATRLNEAHNWNQFRTKEAMENGISPIVIDNTNVKLFAMKAYVQMAKEYNYNIKFGLPETSWAWDANELSKKNTHGVPLKSIERMLNNFESQDELSDEEFTDKILNS